MFIFYDIEYLCLLNDMKQLELVVDDGYKVFVPYLQLQNYSSDIKSKISNCENLGFLTMIDCDEFQNFLNKNNLDNSPFGKGFLFLLHCCVANNLILVINNAKPVHVALCKKLNVSILSIEDFNKEVIKNKQYYDFLTSNKDKIIV